MNCRNRAILIVLIGFGFTASPRAHLPARVLDLGHPLAATDPS